MTTAEQTSRTYPLDNLTYDLLTIIQEKSQALEAYDKYQRDAESDGAVGQLLQQIRQQDEQAIEQLLQHLARRLGSGGNATSTSGGESGNSTLTQDETLTGHVSGEESTGGTPA